MIRPAFGAGDGRGHYQSARLTESVTDGFIQKNSMECNEMNSNKNEITIYKV